MGSMKPLKHQIFLPNSGICRNSRCIPWIWRLRWCEPLLAQLSSRHAMQSVSHTLM